jgi:hypothetical protein
MSSVPSTSGVSLHLEYFGSKAIERRCISIADSDTHTNSEVVVETAKYRLTRLIHTYERDFKQKLWFLVAIDPRWVALRPEFLEAIDGGAGGGAGVRERMGCSCSWKKAVCGRKEESVEILPLKGWVGTRRGYCGARCMRAEVPYDH